MAPIGQMSPATAIAHGRCPCALINTNPRDQLDLDGYTDAIEEYAHWNAGPKAKVMPLPAKTH